MTDAEAVDELDAGARTLGVPLSSRQLERLLAYMTLIERWGAVYNLTAVRDRPGIVRQHLLDSLAIVPSLDRHASTVEGPLKLLDVGSGAGLPGLVVAIAQPAWRVTCVDAVGKKAGFMRQVAAELGLHATVRHARVESLDSAEWHVIVSRAFASLQDFATLSAASLAPGGCWLAMKAKAYHAETETLDAASVFHVEPIHVPGLDVARTLVWMRPREQHGEAS